MAKYPETWPEAAKTFRLAGTANPSLSGYYNTRAGVVQARAAHLPGQSRSGQPNVLDSDVTSTSTIPKPTTVPPPRITKLVRHHTHSSSTGQQSTSPVDGIAPVGLIHDQPSEPEKDGKPSEGADYTREEELLKAMFAAASFKS